MSTPEPYSARGLPQIPVTDANKKIFTNILTAVNGFPYEGERTEAIAYALRYLRANPIEARIILGMLPGGKNALDTNRSQA